MKTIALALLLTIVPLLSPASDGADIDTTLTEKVREVIKEASSVKVGDKRAHLEKFFKPDGGISTRTHQTYVSKRCLHIKIDVQFQPIGDRPGWPSGRDIIQKISRPYLAHPIFD